MRVSASSRFATVCGLSPAILLLAACNSSDPIADLGPADPLSRAIVIEDAGTFDFPAYGQTNKALLLSAATSAAEDLVYVASGASNTLYVYEVVDGQLQLASSLPLPQSILAGNVSRMIYDLVPYGERRLAIANGGFGLFDASDPHNIQVLGTAAVPLVYAEGGSSPNAAIINSLCMMDDRYLFLARDRIGAHVAQSPLLGSGKSSGVDVVDVEAVIGEMGVVQPLYHLETPWLTEISACVAQNHTRRVYVTNDGYGYWPMPPAAILALLGAGLTQATFEVLLAGMLDADGPDVSALAWVPSDNVLANVRAIGNELDAPLSYTYDMLAPTDPPGPFAIPYGAIMGLGDLRGNGPIYVGMTASNATTVLGLISDLLIALFGDPSGGGDVEPDAGAAMDILLNQMLPYYCWLQNPMTGLNDFESASTQCVAVLPRYGLESLLFATQVLDGSATLDEALAGAHAQILTSLGYPNVEAGAATLAQYNIEVINQYTWLFNRVAPGMPSQTSVIDFSDPSQLGAFVPPPTWSQIASLLGDIRVTLEDAAAADLAAGGALSASPETLFSSDFGDAVLPLDFGDSYRYPVASTQDPAAAAYGAKQGTELRTWGTTGLVTQAALVSYSTERAAAIPGTDGWLNTTSAGWDIIMPQSTNAIHNAYHLGAAFPAAIETGVSAVSLPVRIAESIPVELDYTEAEPIDGLGLDSRTVALVDFGDLATTSPREGRVDILDIASLAVGQEPVILWSGILAARSRLEAAVVLPRAGLIFVFGYTIPEDGSDVQGQAWRLSTDIPYIY